MAEDFDIEALLEAPYNNVSTNQKLRRKAYFQVFCFSVREFFSLLTEINEKTDEIYIEIACRV